MRPALFGVFLVSSWCQVPLLGLHLRCCVFLPLRFRFVPLPLRRTHFECVRCDGPPPCRSVHFHSRRGSGTGLLPEHGRHGWAALQLRMIVVFSFCRHDRVAFPSLLVCRNDDHHLMQVPASHVQTSNRWAEGRESSGCHQSDVTRGAVFACTMPRDRRSIGKRVGSCR